MASQPPDSSVLLIHDLDSYVHLQDSKEPYILYSNKIAVKYETYHYLYYAFISYINQTSLF